MFDGVISQRVLDSIEYITSAIEKIIIQMEGKYKGM